MELNKEPKELLPSFYIVTLRAADKETKTMCMYTNFTVAHTPEDAIEIVTATLQDRDTTIYNEGLGLGGWEYAHHHAIPAEKIERMFDDVGNKVREVKDRNRKETKNQLMQRIIKTKDVNLLHSNIEQFTEPERQFLHEKITT